MENGGPTHEFSKESEGSVMKQFGVHSCYILAKNPRRQNMKQKVMKNVQFGEERSVNKLKVADKGGAEKIVATVK